ncbi:HAD family hydrolase [Marinomonas sp. C2222]|uniref:HAD family hydrolase n=1 Tax=Marinomonas sargassi TaxID=2984494 RepID=A0ABT2YSA3_9GAMM|nr:HAD family hydrolase [Marinomonas sargassi]MCV2402777.1 HAD family hydrolase [Marinomonas sargassi]
MINKTVSTIAFDADDTLWRNEDIFIHAQDEFIKLLLAYHDENFIRSHLNGVQVKNLKHFGYGVKGFTLSMIETAIELTEGRIVGSEVHQIIELARRMLATPIELLDNVKTTLKMLKKDYRLIVITKGDLLDQESKFTRSGLVGLFDAFEVVSDKTTESYNQVLTRNGIDKSSFLMVGNSLKSDILPVLDLGAQAIHIPYHSTWEHEEVENKVLENYPQLQTLSDIQELPSWLTKSK